MNSQENTNAQEVLLNLSLQPSVLKVTLWHGNKPMYFKTVRVELWPAKFFMLCDVETDNDGEWNKGLEEAVQEVRKVYTV